MSAAIYDNTMQESPNRLNPNQVLRRERVGATDQHKEEAYRRENYALFQRNLALAFDQYNQAKGEDGMKDKYLDRDEFSNFMQAKARATGTRAEPELIEAIYQEMDANQDGQISLDEFIDLQFKAFKNCEDNIEFLANDIKSFDGKILEVRQKLSALKERETGHFIDGIPIMKGSTLTFTIIDGEFDEQFFDQERFEPMIEIIRKSRIQVNQVDVRE